MALSQEQILKLRSQYGIGEQTVQPEKKSVYSTFGQGPTGEQMVQGAENLGTYLQGIGTATKKATSEFPAKFADAIQPEALSKPGIANKLVGVAEAGLRSASAGLETIFAPVGEAVSPIVTPVLKGVASGIDTALHTLASTSPEGKNIADTIYAGRGKFQKALEENPEAAKDIMAGINVLGAILGEKLAPEQTTVNPKRMLKEARSAVSKTGDVITEGIAGTSRVSSALTETATNALNRAKTTLFSPSKPAQSVDEVILQAEKGVKDLQTAVSKSADPSVIRSIAEEATNQPTIVEKWAGVRPDIKNRIAGKQTKLQEYFDVAHARNNFDTLPTPLEHGAKSVETAVQKMESILNDTGSEIGTFRKKVGTYQANIDQVAKVEKTFVEQLGKLNLEIKKGKIRQIPGTVTRTNAPNEIKVLQELYADLLTVKQNPNLEKLIDLRNRFDAKINFEKSARDVSSSLDPASRAVRKSIADVGAEVVGKSEAAKLKQYSDFIDAYNELRSFTDRKAGAEFLLKQVLSERGGTPREVIQSVKDITGIDLMDDAVMAQLATDLIGNNAQKGLFRQEITKAGLDVAGALTGDPKGALNLLLSGGKKLLLNEEKQFLKAAK